MTYALDLSSWLLESRWPTYTNNLAPLLRWCYTIMVVFSCLLRCLEPIFTMVLKNAYHVQLFRTILSLPPHQ
ncbi:hypothetical protein P691DRAFT_211611 [Macrolepiota fuliginosa MF-IS2]|uniref:Uncharacterized protein n=1 Tax=Macrolepiota fuliginosa MF-IS2 TaxID=1400762 RepID=A0A9P5XAL4_9AGAR|nr:hypothetical protein P691DRAFT_211611 [Macrolepiota fuliginosa MF-IS2]